MERKILFLDRDGPINVVGPRGFVADTQHFHFTDGIFELCREALEKDYRIIIITNQTGVGLGDYTEEQMRAVHKEMFKKFEENGVEIDDIFYTLSPTSPNRKPSPGMYRLAKEKFELTDMDMFMSLSIGDRKKDAEAALRAGVGSVIYLQTDKAMDEKWNIIDRKPVDLVKEVNDLRTEFQTLAILGALAKEEGLEQEPRLIVKQGPKMTVIKSYKELEGRL